MGKLFGLMKNAHLYSKKTINSKFYQTIKIDKNDE